MAQPELPEESPVAPETAPAAPSSPPEGARPEPDAEPGRKAHLPDPRGALPIPDHFRLPFHGKMVTPTSVPSATQRRYNLNHLRRRRQRRGFLLGLLVAQMVIIALDVGGELFLKTHPNVKLREPISVAGIVFLGMSAGAIIMCVGGGLISFGVAAFRAVRRSGPVTPQPPKSKVLVRAVLAPVILLVTMGVILGTAWFMIPSSEWSRTVGFARRKGTDALHVSQSMLRSCFTRSAQSR